MTSRGRLRRQLADLERARESLARARSSGADPWRIQELQIKYDRLNEAAMDAEFEPEPGPRVRGPAQKVPVE